MMNTQSTKSWLITGVSSGFGRELMLAALERGDRVMGTVRNPDQLKSIEQLAPGRALAAVLDVNDENTVKSTVDKAFVALDGIDVIVNNAGFGLLGAIEEATAREVEDQFATNVFGALNVVRAAMPHLRQQESGHILNITSIGGLVGYPGWGIYNGTKYALEGISAALGKEVANFGIKVTAVEPSAFRTDWAGRSLKIADTAITAYAPHSPRQSLDELNGKQPGDPARAAQAMLKLVDMPEPPAQLLLGSAAYTEAVQTYQSALAQFEAHAEFASSADFPTE